MRLVFTDIPEITEAVDTEVPIRSAKQSRHGQPHVTHDDQRLTC